MPIQGMLDLLAIRNPQSAIRNPQSAIRNPQSAIRNPQSHAFGCALS
jgi:major type 1 subunit fimbrin (pilin)